GLSLLPVTGAPVHLKGLPKAFLLFRRSEHHRLPEDGNLGVKGVIDPKEDRRDRVGSDFRPRHPALEEVLLEPVSPRHKIRLVGGLTVLVQGLVAVTSHATSSSFLERGFPASLRNAR